MGGGELLIAMSVLSFLVRKTPGPVSEWLRRFLPIAARCEILECESLLAVDDGRYDIAEALLLNAVRTAEGNGKPHAAALARAHFRIAGLYLLLHEVEKAEQAVRKSLAVAQIPLSPAANLLPDAFELLAEAQFGQGNFAEAQQTVRKSLQVLANRWPEKNADLAHWHWIYARLLFRNGQYEGAVPLYHSALRTYIGIEGPESASVTQLVLELGNAQRKSGNCSAAIETLERALRTQEAASGTMSLAVTPYLSLLGAAYADSGHPRLAVECYHRTLEIYDTTMPAGHPKVGYVLFHLASSLNGLRRFPEAERMARQAVDILRLADDAGLSEATQVLAAIKADRGQDEEADRLFSSALLMLERRVGEKHIEVAESLDRHAAVVWKLGRYEEAEEMMTRAKEIRKTVTTPAGVI